MTAANFRVSTDILQRLGEELITGFSQGIVELVKNSYDADATWCRVELIDTDRPGGTVIITDDGDGMSSEDIQDGWLVIGRSKKVSNVRTRGRRLPAGSKGLGRLGALRMGEEVLLSTRPRSNAGVEFQLIIKWSDFSQSEVVEDVGLAVEHFFSEGHLGTQIEIRGLRDRINELEARTLARELVLLSDPFGDPSGFRPELVASDFSELEKLVRERYFDECEYRLFGQLDSEGRASAKVFDRTGNLLWVNSSDEFQSNYLAPPATFELWVFLLNRESFASRSVTLGEVRAWLQEVGGVHLFHRGLRVRPYGDPGHDWLDMNLSRSRDPELRPSTNTSVGRITILDENEVLLQKTDRTGFVENEVFLGLRRFGMDLLNWMQTKRLAQREERRREKKQETKVRSEIAEMNLQRAIAELAPGHRPAIQQAASELETARISERDVIQGDLSLYQTLASVGTAVSVLAHDIEGPATNLTVSVRTVERRTRGILGVDYDSKIGRSIEDVKRYAELVSRFSTLPLRLLRRGKRRWTILEVNETIAETVSLFEPFLRDARVETTCEFGKESAKIRGSVSAIECIVSNLITNAVKAFRRQEMQLHSRKLVLRSNLSDGWVSIHVMDNGPGIQKDLGDSIWLPGVTVDEDGTGIGLTIVRDMASDLGGRVFAVPCGGLGGAEFIVELPCVTQ